MSKPQSRQPRSSEPELSRPAPSSREGTAPHRVPPDFSAFALPFPTRAERFLFLHPWAVILTVGLAHQAIRLVVDPTFMLVTLVLAASAALFQSWMRDIPALLQHLHSRCPEGERERFEGLVDETRRKLESRRRLIPVAMALGVAVLFLAVFLSWKHFTFRHGLYARALVPGLLLWAWMIGAAGAVAFDMAWFVRTLGGANLLRILPDHPDGCGGLKPLGSFFVRMVSPLLLVAVLLGLASAAPEMNPQQARYFWSRPLQTPFQPPDVSWYDPVPALMVSAVGAERLERLEKKCAELDVPAESQTYQDCIAQLVTESKVIAQAQTEGYHLLWSGSVIPFARAGLLLLIATIAVFFFWTLGSVHQAMVRERDARGFALAQGLEAAEARFSEQLKAQALAEAAELSEHLEKVRRQVRHVSSYPVWPFDAAALSKVAVPQLLALGSTLVGIVSDWLAK